MVPLVVRGHDQVNRRIRMEVCALLRVGDVYDRARKNLDRHPNYILAAYMASGT